MKTLSESAKATKNEYYRQYRSKLSEAALIAKNEYQNKWRKKNPDKVKEYNVTYWERRATVTNKLSVTDNSNKCFQCGLSFDAKRSDSKFCSPACKQKFHRSKSKVV